MEWLTNTNNIIYIIKVFVLTLGAYYTDIKIFRYKDKRKQIKNIISKRNSSCSSNYIGICEN